MVLYLCLLHLATAGRRGVWLGCDQKEVILLIYVVINTLENKVVGVKQYLVKPCLSTSMEKLPKTVKRGTTITPRLVKFGVSLERAIKDFSLYLMNEFQIGMHNNILRFVTDGQCPLRQCLHPEALCKGIQLPTFYNFFHDLRKEFKGFYGLPDVPRSIRGITARLGIMQNADTEFFMKGIEDLVNIIQRLLADGNRFEKPETISLQMEPQSYLYPAKVRRNCAVSVKGLSYFIKEECIVRFFCGLNIVKGGVVLCLNDSYQRNGMAVVAFANEEQCQLALKRSGNQFGKRRISVREASAEEFFTASLQYTFNAHAFLTKANGVILGMQRVPLDYTVEQVLQFFEAGETTCRVMDGVEGVLFLRKRDGTPTGYVYVLFSEDDDARKAYDKLIQFKCEPFWATHEKVKHHICRTMNRKTYNNEPLIAEVPQPHYTDTRLNTPWTQQPYTQLPGFPHQVEACNMSQYPGRHGYDVAPGGINIIYQEGLSRGDAFFPMDLDQSALSAHEHMVTGNMECPDQVYQCFEEDMRLALNNECPGITTAPMDISAAMVPSDNTFLPINFGATTAYVTYSSAGFTQQGPVAAASWTPADAYAAPPAAVTAIQPAILEQHIHLQH